ncbi:MAG TPA: aldo/keto reductase [Desulfomonilia bacterium]|nr:aldo/keto reductase [Desulfomonilia bacterium]
MRSILLGKTGLTVSELGFGGIPIIRLDFDSAVRVVRRACERGITIFDTANAYRDSEAKIGSALEGMRDKVILATKTLRRDAEGALEQLENSLRMLRTDYIDIYQLHQIAQDRDWEIASGPSGALEALIKAREKGWIRYIGVTSHNLAMAIKLVKTGIFATIQFPFNFIEDAARHELFTTAHAMDMGVLAMKPFAGGVIDNAAIAFKFLRDYRHVIPLPGFDAVERVDEVSAFYYNPNTVTKEDRQRMDQYRLELGKQFCRRCEYCQPCPQGVMITSAMGYKIIASRMSAEVAVDFARVPMESVLKCTDCKECIERCPYELPIPDMLKAFYDLYELHRQALGRNDGSW